MNLTQKDINRFRSGVTRSDPDDCWFWKRGCDQKGYGQFKLNGKTELTHRVAWTLVNGLIPKFFENLPTQICHSCDNPPCCNPAHLFLGNSEINMKDSAIKGRHSYPQPWKKREQLWCQGEFNPCALITNFQAKEIKVHYKKGGITQKEIAKIYGVTQATVCNICSGKSWSHVK